MSFYRHAGRGMECVKFLFTMHFNRQSSKLSRSNRCYHSDCTCQISVEEAMRGEGWEMGKRWFENLALSLCRQLLAGFQHFPTCQIWKVLSFHIEHVGGFQHVEKMLVFSMFNPLWFSTEFPGGFPQLGHRMDLWPCDPRWFGWFWSPRQMALRVWSRLGEKCWEEND